MSTFTFERADATTGHSIPAVLDAIKNAMFQAINNLHDCVASSQWSEDSET